MSKEGGGVREIPRDWILITYDLSSKQSYLRQKVLALMRKIGAIQHTQSCYLVPATDDADTVISIIQSSGLAFAWVSSVRDEYKDSLYQRYREKVEALESELRSRVDELSDEILKREIDRKRASKRLRNILQVYDQYSKALARIEQSVDEELAKDVEELRERVEGLGGEKDLKDGDESS